MDWRDVKLEMAPQPCFGMMLARSISYRSFTNNIDITVKHASEKEFLEDLFHLPLSREAYQLFLQMEIIWEDVKQTTELADKDTWTYIWGVRVSHRRRPTKC